MKILQTNFCLIATFVNEQLLCKFVTVRETGTGMTCLVLYRTPECFYAARITGMYMYVCIYILIIVKI